ncbi:hypothetical protein HMPREF0877_1254 [Weissella paramesenteroides ATCC 33313]|uniref:Uncharacterized protein n=1 Tax=Weissella paramesenteroides ATCC 33313 TaxID=585506 RepID=C5RBA8_WEIPA|nr:hypothetical protein HMPREF0877_1254 [Weissella paramesenteroides ATCC 33313]
MSLLLNVFIISLCIIIVSLFIVAIVLSISTTIQILRESSFHGNLPY